MDHKSNKEILFSFIIPTYNSEEFIEESLLSIINQKDPDIEIIIIDGGSKDRTLEIISKYEKYITNLVSEPDKGLYYAINKGIKLSTGKIVKILSSDDLLTSSTMSTVKEIYEKELFDKSHFCILSSLYRINLGGEIIKLWKKTNNIGFFENYLHPTWYVSREVYLDLGLYDTQYKIASDYDYYMRLLQNNVEIIECPLPLAMHREGGISENYTGAVEVYNIKYKYKGRVEANLLLCQNYIFKQLIKVKKTLKLVFNAA